MKNNPNSIMADSIPPHSATFLEADGSANVAAEPRSVPRASPSAASHIVADASRHNPPQLNLDYQPDRQLDDLLDADITRENPDLEADFTITNFTNVASQEFLKKFSRQL